MNRNTGMDPVYYFWHECIQMFMFIYYHDDTKKLYASKSKETFL